MPRPHRASLLALITCFGLRIGAAAAQRPPAPAPPATAAESTPTVPTPTVPTVPTIPTIPTVPAPDARELFGQAMAAREAGDVATYLARLEAAARVHPEPRQLGFRLAGALALAGRTGEALDRLDEMAQLGIWRDLAAEPDFAPLRVSPRWAPLLRRHAALRESAGAGRVAFRLAERDLLIEGIAHDPGSGDFFLGSVHHGKVVRRRPDGTTSDFAGLGGLAPLGLAVDAPRGRLWAVAADLPQVARREETTKGSTFLLAFDLSNGRELLRVAPPGGPGQALNDLVVAGDGTVFASDGQTGAVWSLAPGAAAFEPVLPAGALRSAGGLALDGSGERLLVADWSRGLAMVERRGGRWWRVTTPADLFPVGIDGLVAHRGGFVAIQNGFLPSRVLRFELAPDGTAVTRFEVLERAHPDHAEPTLGVVVGDDLYYVANSQWEEFGEDGRPRAPERLAAPAVIRLPLR